MLTIHRENLSYIAIYMCVYVCVQGRHRAAGAGHGQALCAIWLRDPEDCAGPSIHRGGRQVRTPPPSPSAPVCLRL